MSDLIKGFCILLVGFVGCGIGYHQGQEDCNEAMDRELVRAERIVKACAPVTPTGNERTDRIRAIMHAEVCRTMKQAESLRRH